MRPIKNLSNKMKSRATVAVIAGVIWHNAIMAAEPSLPPENLRASWMELAEFGFTGWKIAAYKGFAEPFDGGSKVFSFETDEGVNFAIMAANPKYWTDADRLAGKQVFYLLHKNRFYRVEPKSDKEAALISMLESSKLASGGNKNARIVRKLVERLQNRISMFKKPG